MTFQQPLKMPWWLIRTAGNLMLNPGCAPAAKCLLGEAAGPAQCLTKSAASSSFTLIEPTMLSSLSSTWNLARVLVRVFSS
jgi:hypothetical protein